MKPRPARGEISETPRDASEGAEGRPSFFDGLQDGSLVQVRIENRLFMSWLIPKTGTRLSDKVRRRRPRTPNAYPERLLLICCWVEPCMCC